MSAPTIDIQPNTNGRPGLAALESIVGALLTFVRGRPRRRRL
jgi:hypothetical protein